jgi:hypothetical protein
LGLGSEISSRSEASRRYIALELVDQE